MGCYKVSSISSGDFLAPRSLLCGVVLGGTLNFAPTQVVNVPCGKKKKKGLWREFTPDQQKNIFLSYIGEQYHGFDSLYLVFEFTKGLMLHCHFIGFINDKASLQDYYLAKVRASVRQSPKKIVCIKDCDMVTSNYIHSLVDVDKWKEYMVKDLDKTPYGIILCIPFLGE